MARPARLLVISGYALLALAWVGFFLHPLVLIAVPLGPVVGGVGGLLAFIEAVRVGSGSSKRGGLWVTLALALLLGTCGGGGSFAAVFFLFDAPP